MIRTLFLQQLGHIQRTPRKREAWDFIRPIIFGIGLMFALIPSFYPITDHEFVILPMMAIVIFITHLALTLRTLSVAASICKWGEGAEAWDVLSMTAISARELIEKTQREIMSRVWFDHVVFSLLRLGLAVGIAQLLHMINVVVMQRYQLAPLFYYSMYDPLVPGSPDVLQIILGASLLIGFSLLEAHLLAALHLFVRLWMTKGGLARHLGVTLMIRILFILGVVVLWLLLEQLKNLSLLESTCAGINYCFSLGNDGVARGKWITDMWQVFYNIDGARMALSVLGDNATLLIADLIRPSFGILFIFAMLPRIAFAVVLYRGIIRLLMWMAMRLAVRRGMLP